MSDTESLDYLQPGFDPATLTIPRLRSILVSYNIPYPASSNKPKLIEIFNENVVPQSKKILSQRARARRTSKGITDAESSQESNFVADDQELMPPPPTPRPKTARKSSTKIKLEDSESETPKRSTAKKPRSTSGKSRKTSESDTGTDVDGVKKSARKSRKSETPTPAKAEYQEPELPTPHVARSSPLDMSVFSDDNPFQSGSSPLSGVRSVSGDNRRVTTGSSTSKDPTRRKTSSTTVRRRTDGPIPSMDVIEHSSRFEMPISKLTGLKNPEDDGVQVTEEFTPEEHLELVRERSLKGESALGPVKRRKKSSKQSKAATPIWILLATLLSGYAVWYRKEKLDVGYCGVGREPRELGSQVICTPKWAADLNAPDICKDIEIPDWLVTIAEPNCEPCPQHATCFDKLETVCDQDFVIRQNPLSLGGLIPIPPTCEPDGEKVKRVKIVADRAVEELRERRAKFECGELVEEDGSLASSAEIDAEDLKKEVIKHRRRGMSEAEFEDLWAGAIGEIQGRDEVEVVVDGPPSNGSSTTHSTRLSSTSLARIPLICSIRRGVRLAVARNRLQISILALLIALGFYGRTKTRHYLADRAAVPDLVSMTLDRLAAQAAWHVQDKAAYPEAWISIGQLRDDVLRDEHSVSRREALWGKVRSVVESNANVRPAQRESRNGEISRVWEWIGAVAAIEPGDIGERERERRRKSGRVSWGAYGDGSSPVSGMDGGPELVQAKWAEGRPIY